MALGIPYSLLLSLPDGNQMFSIRRNGFSLKTCVGESGKHQVSSCHLVIAGSDILQVLMTTSKTLIDAKVRDSQGNVLFTGVVRPYASVSIEQTRVGDVSLEVLDYTEVLHKKVNEDVADYLENIPSDVIFSKAWDSIQICNPSDKSKSAVHELCALCGISDIEAPSISAELRRFEIKAGDYIDEVLSSLLYEFVYDYRFDENGKMIIFQTSDIVKGDDEEDITRLPPEGTIDVFNLGISLSRSDQNKTGVVVKYNKYVFSGDFKIWEKSMNCGSTWVLYQNTLGRDTFFDKDVEWDLSEIENDKGTAIRLSGFYGKGHTGTNTHGSVKTDITEASQTGGHVKVSLEGGWGWGKGRITGEVYADVSYLRPEEGTMGTPGDDAEVYSATYLESREDALTLYFALASRQEQSIYQYSFQSKSKLTPGSLYSFLENKVSGIETRVRILSREQSDDTGLYQYKAEGYGDFSLTPPDFSHENPDEDVTLEPDFFLIDASVLSFAWDAEADAESIVTVAGNIFDKYKAVPRWFIRNSELIGETDTVIHVKKSQLAVGINRISCKAEYEGAEYEIYVDIRLEDAEVAISMQFAAVPKGESPDSSTVWLDEQPVPGDDEVLWMRFRTTASGEWIVVKMTAEDGGNPVVFFQWAATPYIKPDDAYELLTWDDMAITWEVDGNVTGFVLDSGRWETLVPDKPFGLNYLWVKYWNYQEEQWDYFCTTGTPAMDFNLIVNPQTFKLTSRGVTQEDSSYSDRCQRINVRCQRLNTTAPISWSIEPENEQLLSWERVDDNDDSEIVIVIKTMIALPNITIHCSIADIDVAKEFVVSGVQEGIAEIMYMGIFTSTGAFPNTTSEGPLMVGDHVLLEESNGNRTPYYWNGSAWVMADANTPVEFAWKMLSNVLYDATHAPGTISSQSIVNLFAQNFAAYNAFIYNLMVRNLRVGAGSSTSGFRFDVYDYQNGSRVTPVIRAMYNGSVVFQINPSTGDVFFGRPNSQLNAPATGFMYDASAGTLRSVNDNVVIGTNGAITAKSGNFSGKVTATSGSFSGTLNAAKGTITDAVITNSTVSGVLISGAIRTEQSQYGDYSVTLYKDDWYQASSFMTSLVKYGGYNYIWGSSIWLRATSPEIPDLAYINYFTTMHSPPNDGVVQGNNIIMYDSNMEDLDITKLGLPYVQYGSGAISNGIQCFENSSGTGLSRYTIIDQDFTINVTWGETLVLNVPFAGLRDMVQGQVYAESDGTLKIHF